MKSNKIHYSYNQNSLNSINQKNNFYSLDFLRGLASIIVCLFHISIISRLKFSANFKDFFSFGHLGVQIFFVISGFVIPYSMHKGKYNIRKIKTFFLKRFIRIHPPYLISILLVILINVFFYFSPYFNEELISLDLKNFISHFFYLNDILHLKWLNQVFWSLAIEFQFYIYISIFFKFIESDKNLIWIVFLMFNIVLSIIFPIHYYLTGHLPYFMLGITLFRYIFNKESITSLVFYLIVICSLLTYNYDFEFVIAGIFPILCFFLFKKYSIIIEFLSKISYSLYLIHAPISQSLIKVGSYYCSNFYHEIILISSTFTLTIFCSYLFFKFVENPFKNIASKLKY